jgi:hypothetical protein
VGQNARLTFSGTANQTISLNMGNGTMGWALASIIKPDGSYLINPSWTNGGGFFGATVLPADGTYTIVIDPEYGNIGSMTFTLNDLSSSGAMNITPGDSTVTVTANTSGQNPGRTFDTVAGHRASINTAQPVSDVEPAPE